MPNEFFPRKSLLGFWGSLSCLARDTEPLVLVNWIKTFTWIFVQWPIFCLNQAYYMKCHWNRLHITTLVRFNEKYNPYKSSFINFIHSPLTFKRFFILFWASSCARLCKFSFPSFLRLLLLTFIICDKIVHTGTCVCVCACARVSFTILLLI